MLRDIARAPTVHEFEVAVARLKDSPVWASNAALRQWFERTWLREHKVVFLPVTLLALDPMLYIARSGVEILSACCLYGLWLLLGYPLQYDMFGALLLANLTKF